MGKKPLEYVLSVYIISENAIVVSLKAGALSAVGNAKQVATARK